MKSLLLMLVMLTTSATLAGANGITPVTEGERQSVVVGIGMGLDIALAYQGLPRMTTDKFIEVLSIFNEATDGCTNVGCITDRVSKLRDAAYQSTMKKKNADGLEMLQ